MKSILISRIHPARNAGKTVFRKKLNHDLSVNSEKSLILICSPGGYGKTTLVQEFLFTDGSDYAWLNIHSDMNNFFVFMNYLVSAIKIKIPEFGHSFIPLLEENRIHIYRSKKPEAVIKDMCLLFINELYSINKRYYIILDDLGNIENAVWLKDVMASLTENLPKNISIIVTSRSLPALSGARINSKRGIFKLAANDLEFDEEETGYLLEDLYGLKWNRSEIHDFTLKLRGWVTGMHLILQGSNKDQIEKLLNNGLFSRDIFDYFTEDVFINLPEDLKHFAMYISLAESFSIKLCNELFTGLNCDELITELIKRNLFLLISSSNNHHNEPSYIFHPLFKKFLNEKINLSEDKSRIKEFRKKLIEHSVLNRNFSDAINYSISSGETELAFRLIHENFHAFFNSGFFDVLWNWLELLNTEYFSENAQYLYYRALLLKFYMGKTGDALQILDKAVLIAAENKNNELLAGCTISRARILINLGKISEALNILKEIEDIDVNRSIKIRIQYLSAYAHYNNGDYERTLILLNRASVYLNEEILTSHGEAEETKTDIYNLYGHIYLIRGEFIKSISYYEIVARSSVKLTGKFETLCNLILLHSQSGNFEKASDLLAQAEELLERIPIPIIRITYLLASQAFYFEFGDYMAATRLLKELNALAFEMNHKYYIYLSYSLLGDCYYYLSDNIKAEEYYELSQQYMNKESRLERIQSDVSKELLRIDKIKNDPSEFKRSEEILLNAYNYYKNSKMHHSLMQIMYIMARLYAENNEKIKALIFAGEAIDISKDNDYRSFLQRELIKDGIVLNLSELNRYQKEFVKGLKQEYIRKQYASFINDDQRSMIKSNSVKISNIYLKFFGANEIYIGGKAVDDSFWTKKKWRSMFLYFMFEQCNEINKDRMLEIFYRESSLESSENLFHQFISKIRNLFKTFSIRATGNIKNNLSDDDENADYIFKYENRTLKLNNDLIIYSDVMEFDRIICEAEKEKNLKNKINLYKNAILLYIGKFLEGNYDTWAEDLRVIYSTKFTEICEKAIGLLNNEKRFEESEKIAEELIEHDRSNLLANEVIIKKLIRKRKIKVASDKLMLLKKVYKEELNSGLPAEYIYRLENELVNCSFTQ